MYSIGYDLGSSSLKAALVETESGKIIALTSEPKGEMGMLSTQPNWAEQDPNYWWELVCIATKKLLKESGIDAKKIESIGIAYQMHGLVVVDSSGTPLRNAIIWCDSRAVSIGGKAFQELGEDACMTHLLNSPANFTASKLKWVRDNEPDVYEKTHKYMLPGDFIAYKFSGEITTTVNGLSEGTLWDFKAHQPANFLLEHYGLNSDLTPEIVSNFSVQGRLRQQAAEETGLAVGTPICYRAGDQPNNAFALNVMHPGEVAATGGTSGVVYALTDNKTSIEPERINHFAHVNYTQESPVIGKLLCINGAGISYRWIRNNLKVSNYAEMNQLAAQQPIGSKGVSVLPFGNGAERMLNNKTIGSHFLNLDLNTHNAATLCRATLEGIAFSFVYGIEIMQQDNAPINVIRTGNDNLFQSEVFSQTIATLTGKKIELYNTTGAVGAAKGASMHVEALNTSSSSSANNPFVGQFSPEKDASPYQEAYLRWKEQLKKQLN